MRIRPQPRLSTILISRGHSTTELAFITGVDKYILRALIETAATDTPRYVSQLTARKIAHGWARVTGDAPDIVFEHLFVIERIRRRTRESQSRPA